MSPASSASHVPVLLDEVVEKLFAADGYWTNAPVPTEGHIGPRA